MQTLQQRLRQVRSWQGKTLGNAASQSNLPTKDMVAIESGDVRYLRPTLARLSRLAKSYCVTDGLLEQLLDDEYVWRESATTGNPEILPRIAQYLYRPLPDVARHFLSKNDFVILDTETTGVNPHLSETEIVEIAIVGSNGETVLNTLIKPSRPIMNSAIHGITDEMVANEPAFHQVYPDIRDAIQNKIVIAYNADFDCYLLDKEIVSRGFDMPTFDQYCLMLSYADFYAEEGQFGGFAWQKLFKACAQQEVVMSDVHRALGDARSTYNLLIKLASLDVPLAL